MTYINPRPQHPTIQTDVTASRAINATVYRNTGLYPIFAVISVISATTGDNGLDVYCDAQATPTTKVVRGSLNATVYNDIFNVSFIVLPGYYYKATTVGTLTLSTWIELS